MPYTCFVNIRLFNGTQNSLKAKLKMKLKKIKNQMFKAVHLFPRVETNWCFKWQNLYEQKTKRKWLWTIIYYVSIGVLTTMTTGLAVPSKTNEMAYWSRTDTWYIWGIAQHTCILMHGTVLGRFKHGMIQGKINIYWYIVYDWLKAWDCISF